MTPVRQPFTPQQLEVRRPIWLGMAELFLDTDTRPGLPALALTLAQSGLPETELEAVWETEVASLLSPNLYSVAGEWAGWDESWLLERLRARGMLRVGWPPLQRLRAGGLNGYFHVALSLSRDLLALPEADRQGRAAAWSWLAHAYFWLDFPWHLERPTDPDLRATFLALESWLTALLTPREHAEQHRLYVLHTLEERS